MKTKVRAAVLANYIEVAQSLKLDPHSLLRKVGLNKTILSNPDNQISIDAALALLEDSTRESGCITFGLLMAESRQLSDFGVVSLVLTHQKTLRDVMRTIIQYRHLLNGSLAMHIEDVGDRVIIREEIMADNQTFSRQGIELALGVLHRMCNALLESHWHPISIHFTHNAPADLNLHRRIFGFGSALEFGSEFNGILCNAANFDYPNPTADPVMAQYAERLMNTLPAANQISVVKEVRRTIYFLLPMGRATIEQVAQGLGLNVRSLQRQLEGSGSIFSDLVNDVRRELAVRYIENPKFSLSHIAELLGYAMPKSANNKIKQRVDSPGWRWSSFGLGGTTLEKARIGRALDYASITLIICYAGPVGAQAH
jgi:AraC-like DNA-binding protein